MAMVALAMSRSVPARWAWYEQGRDRSAQQRVSGAIRMRWQQGTGLVGWNR